jgi:replicative DNA helicase
MNGPAPIEQFSPAPHNIEAEQGLLGAILINNEAGHVVDGLIEPDDFFEPIHRDIYSVSRDLFRAGKIASPVTLRNYLPAGIDIAGMPLARYLARLAAEAVTVIHARDYAASIHDLRQRRELIAISRDLTEIAAAAPPDLVSRNIAQEAIERLDEIAAPAAASAVSRVTMGEASQQAVDRMCAVMARNGAIGGLTTGLRTLDRRIDGWHRGEFAIMGGRPGMGKTGVALSSAVKTAASGSNVLFFSIEMPAATLAMRAMSNLLFSRDAAVPYFNISNGSLSDTDAERVVDAQRDLRELPLVIEQEAPLCVSQIRARIRKVAQRLERQGKSLDLVVVDHVHLIAASDRYSGNRTAEITEISGGLKATAKEFNVAMLALAQLNRSVEGREDKRPTMADLRDSGALEQDADLIIFLFREQYYLERQASPDPATEDRRIARLAEVHNKLELLIAKQRNGPTGTLQIFFDAANNAAADLEGRSYE